MMQLIELFQTQNWHITFASSATESEFSEDLNSVGVETVSVKLNSSTFDEYVKELNPQIVVFDRFMTEEQFGWRVVDNCPSAIRVLDTEDLHCLRNARHQALKQNREFQVSDLLKEDAAKREIASIYRCDLSLIISEYEMEVLRTIFKVDGALLQYLPFMLKPISEEEQEAWLPFAERRHFVTIGNFLHPPNWDSVQHLRTEIWPLIRKELPETEMHVYGAYCVEKHRQLHSEKDGFLIKGRAEDALEVISNAKVLLAPLRFGAGLKGKLIEAMQCGTPSVTTTIGAEAMRGNLPWNGAITDSPEAFAKAAVQLYTDEKAWKIAQQKGAEIINRVYRNEQLGKTLLDRLKVLESELHQHREANFAGAMLQYHTARSTEFMSRWIELKNAR